MLQLTTLLGGYILLKIFDTLLKYENWTAVLQHSFIPKDAMYSCLVTIHQHMIRNSPLKKRERSELKCVPQLFLGSLLGTRRSAIGLFFFTNLKRPNWRITFLLNLFLCLHPALPFFSFSLSALSFAFIFFSFSHFLRPYYFAFFCSAFAIQLMFGVSFCYLVEKAHFV